MLSCYLYYCKETFCKGQSHKIFTLYYLFNCSSDLTGFGDINISAILNSFQMGYDKRVRPNYGGKSANS